MTDVVIVGSGPGGVNAAAPLVEAGRRVVLLDYGNEDRHYAPLIPDLPFCEIRRTHPEQHRYFLGERFEGIPFGAVRVGAQLTPPRMHILADAAERIPVESEGLSVSMSLARGGLGAGWSAGVFPFSDDELREMSMSLAELRPHYDAVTERVGVAGDRDDLAPFFPSSPSMMPALDIDSNGEAVLERYRRKRKALNAAGFFLGRPWVAACTRRHRERGPDAYHDMAFWADPHRSIYRPQWTLEELQRASTFTYLGRRFVESFVEENGRVRVRVTHADTGAEEWHEGAALVLAAGTLGTAWIVLRSLGCYDTRVPILCNPHAYVPTLNLGMLGREPRDRRYSVGQLTAMVRMPSDPHRVVQAQLLSYRSLLTFKLMKELPLAYQQSLGILRLLIPNLAILAIHHADRPAPGKFCVLRRGKDGGADRLEIRYHLTPEEDRTNRADERVVARFFRRLGCLPLKIIRLGHGASLHYAGTFPITSGDEKLTCDPHSRLRGTRAVYVADGSVFPWIPPKGLTFNLMANANRVGTLLREVLR